MHKLTLALVFALASCSKEKAPSSAEPVIAASGAASSSSNASPVASAPHPAAAWYVGSWKGDYNAQKRASTTKTKEGAPAAWEKDEGQKLTGPGTIEVAITDAGDVSGILRGGLGELSVRGKVDGEQLRANVNNQGDDSAAIQNGYLVLSRDAETLRGRLFAGSGDSLTLREAEITIKKVSP